MSHKLTVVIAGQRQSGRTTLARYIVTEFLNCKIGKKRFTLEKMGKEYNIVDTFNNNEPVYAELSDPDDKNIANAYGVKIYNFEDPMKRICIDVFGLDNIQCYGSEDDKNTATHLSWDDLPPEIRERYSRPRRGSGGLKPASGFMTAKEVMHVFSNDICRRWDVNCWARGLYSAIKQDDFELAVVTNATYPNEVTLGTEIGSKVIRLLKSHGDHISEAEEALGQVPLGEFSLVIDNNNMTVAETNKAVKPHIMTWFECCKII